MDFDSITARQCSFPAAMIPRLAPRLSRLFLAVASIWLASFPAFARADRVIPQVADGAGRIRTKIDITNLSSTTAITRMKICFYKQDSTAWILGTNLGTGSEFMLDLGRSQTVRVETLASGSGLIAGYAVIRDYEGNSTGSLDFQIGVSVFYEVLEGNRTVDTVSVPAGQPTRRWIFPVEIDAARGLYSGLAIVNLSDSTNRVTIKLWTAFPPGSADATDGGTVEVVLAPGAQKAFFLSESALFPQYLTYRGTLAGSSEKPVAVLGLLQTQTQAGVQYATLAVEYADAIPQETYSYLPESLSLDVDAARVPFVTVDEGGSADVLHQVISPTVRYLAPQNGAMLAALGIRTAEEVNSLTLDDLKAAAYAAAPLDVTDISGNFVPGFSFAVKTSVGRFAKVRIDRIVAAGEIRNLVLQVAAYR